ncbi:popeye domain-containing 2 isoform X2 [Coregonus clupeaformis]|uniref:popeye domain-containing 2 isoform X2 n=1 Tax=Coregonus clupeaformis TaxID=59861 RepID=UPI001E1C8A7E|nr:popeye domain-containing 2 isoform X2 [Coregonus clupeaformis]
MEQLDIWFGITASLTMCADNSTLLEAVLYGHPPCDGWTNNTEGAFYHLGNTVLFLGYMGGSGAYGCLFIFGFQMLAFTCLALWGWMTMCGVDVFSWNLLLLVACVLQICHLIYRLQQDGLTSEELSALYSAVYRPMDVPVQVFQDIVGACENKVLPLGVVEMYTWRARHPSSEGKVIRVSLDGQFLHYIFPHKFMDSPEWESLQPNEEGNFQERKTLGLYRCDTREGELLWPPRTPISCDGFTRITNSGHIPESLYYSQAMQIIRCHNTWQSV